MKTFNVPQFYNGFYCYFESICSSFDKVTKFTLFCLHPQECYVKGEVCGEEENKQKEGLFFYHRGSFPFYLFPFPLFFHFFPLFLFFWFSLMMTQQRHDNKGNITIVIRAQSFKWSTTTKGKEGREDLRHCYCANHGCEYFIHSKAIIVIEVVAEGAKKGVHQGEVSMGEVEFHYHHRRVLKFSQPFLSLKSLVHFGVLGVSNQTQG